jgi:hypothetical protein
VWARPKFASPVLTSNAAIGAVVPTPTSPVVVKYMRLRSFVVIKNGLSVSVPKRAEPFEAIFEPMIVVPVSC